jgi:hypothetical protein
MSPGIDRGSALALLWIAAVLPSRSAPAGYAGVKVCAGCHPREYAAQSKSGHAGTLHSGADLAFVEHIPLSAARENVDPGAARYAYEKNGGLSVLVSLGGQTERVQVDWILGANRQGLTFFSRLNGRLFLEHRLSYYRQAGALDITAGQSLHASASFEQALGLPVTAADAFRCINCHSTYVARAPVGGPDFSSIVAGVTCERCHGPGAAHVAAVQSGAAEKRIRNPGKLSGDGILQMCGECHRTEPPPGNAFDDPIVTRFQPVGLQMSACFQKSNAAIHCLTCHNPHKDSRRGEDAYYERRCLRCHQQPSGPICKINSTRGCVSCHMSKVSPLAHIQFTDHWIRIPRTAGGKS